jgi:hypothetical protein
MESPYGKEPFTVLAFTRAGTISAFSRHPQ